MSVYQDFKVNEIVFIYDVLRVPFFWKWQNLRKCRDKTNKIAKYYCTVLFKNGKQACIISKYKKDVEYEREQLIKRWKH